MDVRKNALFNDRLESAVQYGCQRIGIPSLKKEQLDAVKLLLQGQHTFVNLPTGFGKSVIFNILSFCAESLLTTERSFRPVVLVVSPLVSLMRDQVTKLKQQSITAAFIGDHLDSSVTPERLY